MKKIFLPLEAIAIIALLFVSSACAWPIYSKPEFKGRVIDSETKEPIEGSVVVVVYDKRALVGGPGGPSSYIIDAKETLTDNKGEFSLPAFSSLTFFTIDSGTRFIFFKPGYMTSYGPPHIHPYLVEKYLSPDLVGQVAEIEASSPEHGSHIKWKGHLGIIELQKVATKEERRKTRPSSGGLKANQLPLFFQMIEKEYHHLYN
jgi:hypothetical protein